MEIVELLSLFAHLITAITGRISRNRLITSLDWNERSEDSEKLFNNAILLESRT